MWFLVTGSYVAKRIGLLGGTFNPIHIGHLRSAIEIVECLALDELRLIPNAIPPHREQPKVMPQDRLAMVRLAAANIAKLTVDAQELDRYKPSYTIDTLHNTRAQLEAADQLFLIMGMDAFAILPTWHRWQELLQYCHILVLQRPDMTVVISDELQQYLVKNWVEDFTLLAGSCGKITYIQQTPLNISATQIRNILHRKKTAQFLLPDTVLEYINKHQLYQS